MSAFELLKTPLILKIAAFVSVSVLFFYFGNHWSDGYNPVIFFSFSGRHHHAPSISLSPNFNKSFDVSSLIRENYTTSVSEAPPPVGPKKMFGILDDNGTMSDEFEVGEFDPKLVEDWGNQSEVLESGNVEEKSGGNVTFTVQKYGLCPVSMMDYIPCLDNEEAIRQLKSTERGERFERHCPEKGKALNCLLPPPAGYRPPIRWPRSRDEVWFNNVPHTRLVEDKGGQNWITRENDKFKFPGGGTQFIHGANQYLDQMSKLVPDIAFGHHTRVVLDVGCGVASFGAYLMSRDVLTLSIAPKDVHENQIQFALERGLPAMVAALATRRLLYASQAFDLIHCSRCRINWTRDDGILLLEVDRILRAGGYFAWAAQPVYKHEHNLKVQWEGITSQNFWIQVSADLNIQNLLISFPESVESVSNMEYQLSLNDLHVHLKNYLSAVCKSVFGEHFWPDKLLHRGWYNKKSLSDQSFGPLDDRLRLTITKAEMFDLTTRLCWNLVKREGYLAIWQKPDNNSCYLSRKAGTQPLLCDSDDADDVWYVDLRACISRLPEIGYEANVTAWPARLYATTGRLQNIKLEAYISRKELVTAELKYWNESVRYYVESDDWKKMKFRNVMDMRAGFGGFATALIERKIDCWILNVVPVSGPNTLPVLYDRGLLGVMHDWCEPFDTYPRTYDFLHASGLFSVERKRCNSSTIMLEIDRMLRPGGHVYIRDSIDVMDDLKGTAGAIGWQVKMRVTAEGPYASYRVLKCTKRLLHS